MPNLLNISENEWKEAENFFSKNAEAVYKPRDKKNKSSCAFIKVGGEIYAKKHGEALGEGGMGKVKLVQARNGENFAVKIEGNKIEANKEAEEQIMKMLNLTKGSAAKKYEKEYKGAYAEEKNYSIMQLIQGKEMASYFYENGWENQLSYEERVELAIKAAEQINFLHQKHRIIHGDIKPANFMANIEKDMITVAAIDFGFSLILPDEAKYITHPARGTPGYVAPEIVELYESGGQFYPKAIPKEQFSFASDIYALGVMFRDDCKINNAYIDKMCDPDPQNRPNLSEVIKSLKRSALTEQYKSFSDNTLFGHFKENYLKAIGRKLFGKGEKRKEQMDRLLEIEDKLQNTTLHPTNERALNAEDKAKLLYSALYEIQIELKKENNLFKSNMSQLVEGKMKKIEKQYPKFTGKSEEFYADQKETLAALMRSNPKRPESKL